MSIAEWLHERMFKLPAFRGKWRILRFLIPYCNSARSAYGPYLSVRSQDATNLFSLLGSYGYELHALIQRMPINGVYLDIGANTGVYALVAAERLKNGRAYAFEPNSEIFSDIVRNISLNNLSNVTAFNFGIGSSTRLVEFGFRPDHSGAAAILTTNETSYARSATALLVSAQSIDLKRRLENKTVLCKIDVEGAELQVLRSLSDCGALAYINQVFVEVDPKHLARFGDEVDCIYKLMETNGFKAMTGRRGQNHYDEIFEAAQFSDQS